MSNIIAYTGVVVVPKLYARSSPAITGGNVTRLLDNGDILRLRAGEDASVAWGGYDWRLLDNGSEWVATNTDGMTSVFVKLTAVYEPDALPSTGEFIVIMRVKAGHTINHAPTLGVNGYVDWYTSDMPTGQDRWVMSVNPDVITVVSTGYVHNISTDKERDA